MKMKKCPLRTPSQIRQWKVFSDCFYELMTLNAIAMYNNMQYYYDKNTQTFASLRKSQISEFISQP